MASDEALRAIAHRARHRGSYTPAAEQIRALQALVELHDAQLEVAAAGDVMRAQRAVARAQQSGNYERLELNAAGAPA